MVIVNNNVKYSVWGGKKTVCTVHAPELLLKKCWMKVNVALVKLKSSKYYIEIQILKILLLTTWYSKE